jgi:hypothetical protein
MPAGAWEEFSFLLNGLKTLELVQPEVASSGWKSTANRVVSDAPAATHEILEDRVLSTPSHTHNYIRSPR